MSDTSMAIDTPSSSASLTEEVQRLRDRVEELEELLGIRLPVPNKLIKGMRGWQLLGLLRKSSGVVSRDYAFVAIYGGWPECDQPSVRIIDQIVCRANQDLRRHGIAIQTDRGRGYYLDHQSRARLDEIIDKNAGAV